MKIATYSFNSGLCACDIKTMALEDYKDIVATAASITTIGQFFAGIFVCKDIMKQGTTEGISVVPFLGGTAMGVLMMQYANLLNDDAMIQVNVVGLSLNIMYLLCFYAYSHQKATLRYQMLQAALFVGVFLGYLKWEDPSLVEFRFGMIITVILVFLIASPLFSLGEIIRTKSTKTLPFPLILSSTLVTFLWLLYGIIIKNSFIQFQNVLGFLLSAVQLSLFVIYPNQSKVKDN